MNELSNCCEASVYCSNNNMAICSSCKEWCEPIEVEDEQ
jgi:hypothetical protein